MEDYMKNYLLTLSIALCMSNVQSVYANFPNAIPQGGPTVKEKNLRPNYSDVSYGNSSATQTFDLYLPEGNRGTFPIVIYAHPGGFKFGDKTMAPYSIVHALLAKGYAFASVNYRLSVESKFPTAVQDFFKASEFITDHANQYKIDINKIYFFGESAGGNIVALAGLAANSPLFNKGKIKPGKYIFPKGVITLYPPVDFSKIDEFKHAQGCNSSEAQPELTLEEQYIGGRLADNLDKIRSSNPVTYITNSAPAFFIENGDQDCNVGSEQSKLLFDALNKINAKVYYYELEGAGHGGKQFETTENISKIIDFIEK